MATDAMKAAPGVSLEQQPKTYGLLPMVLFAVSAMITLDTVATSAAIGVQGLTFFILGALFFYIPYGFVTAELGSAWPEEGGIYVWIREAYGDRAGGVAAWFYWVNVAYWGRPSSSSSPARSAPRCGRR